MKFEVGELVKVREDLTKGRAYSSEEGKQEFAVTPMVAYAGKLVRIKDIKGQCYLIENSERRWFWVDEMFEKFGPCTDAIHGETHATVAHDSCGVE